jgi:exosortase
MTELPTRGQRIAPARPPSLADMVAPQVQAPARAPMATDAWIKVAIVTGLVVLMSYDQLIGLVAVWAHDSNWTHGFLIPLFSAYLLYSRRNELAAARRKSCIWGLPIVILALVLQVLCVYPIRNDWFYQLNLIVLALGLVLYVGGTEIFRLTWLPIAFLAFGMPLPARLYTMMAYPLQELAAKSSFVLMRLCGAQIENVASSLTVVGLSGKTYSLEVAEMCSGMRSLMAFLALGVAMAYLEDRPNWHRVVFVLSAIPIAICCNILRVTITSCMYLIDQPDFGSGFMHEVTGMIMLVPAFGMLWLVGKVLQSLFVETEDDDDESRSDEPSNASQPSKTEVGA